MEIDVYKTILLDFSTILLTFVGISLSIITLLYSSILTRRDDLKIVSEKMKLGASDPELKRRKTIDINYIRKMDKVNRNLALSSIFQLLLAISCWIFARFLYGDIVKWLFIFSTIGVILILIYFGYVLYRVMRRYLNDVKL